MGRHQDSIPKSKSAALPHPARSLDIESAGAALAPGAKELVLSGPLLFTLPPGLNQ